MEQDNGGPHTPDLSSALVLTWDDEHKRVGVGFNPKVFPNFEFVLAVLETAKRQIENQSRAAQVQQLQRQQQEAALEQSIKRQLLRP